MTPATWRSWRSWKEKLPCSSRCKRLVSLFPHSQQWSDGSQTVILTLRGHMEISGDSCDCPNLGRSVAANIELLWARGTAQCPKMHWRSSLQQGKQLTRNVNSDEIEKSSSRNLVLLRQNNAQGLQMRIPKFKYYEAINLIDFIQSLSGITLLPPTCCIIKMMTLD